MPHKHKRKAQDADISNYDLPPDTVAKPLPVTKRSRSAINKYRAKERDSQRYKNRKNARASQDDTPKAFVRLMNYKASGQRLGGLDDGDRKLNNAKHKRPSATTSEPMKQVATETTPGYRASQLPSIDSNGALQIHPGESMSEFSARVNQALPIAGLNRTAKQLRSAGLGGLVRERQTKREKKIQKMQAAWRQEDAKRKEREEEARDEAEEQEADIMGAWALSEEQSGEGARLGEKRRRGAANKQDDPWAELRSRRESRRGLHDVAQAPPELRQPREKLKVKNGAKIDVANVPASAGSLRRREELGAARKDLIKQYRQMMQQKRNEF